MDTQRQARRRNGEPVTVAEVSAAVLRAIATEFDGRPLDADTARHGLAHAAHELINVELRAVAEQAKGRT